MLSAASGSTPKSTVSSILTPRTYNSSSRASSVSTGPSSPPSPCPRDRVGSPKLKFSKMNLGGRYNELGDELDDEDETSMKLEGNERFGGPEEEADEPEETVDSIDWELESKLAFSLIQTTLFMLGQLPTTTQQLQKARQPSNNSQLPNPSAKALTELFASLNRLSSALNLAFKTLSNIQQQYLHGPTLLLLFGPSISIPRSMFLFSLPPASNNGSASLQHPPFASLERALTRDLIASASSSTSKIPAVTKCHILIWASREFVSEEWSPRQAQSSRIESIIQQSRRGGSSQKIGVREVEVRKRDGNWKVVERAVERAVEKAPREIEPVDAIGEGEKIWFAFEGVIDGIRG